MGRVRDMYNGTMTCTWDREGRICGTNIGKGSVLRVIFEIDIPSMQASVIYCGGTGGEVARGA